MNPTPILTRHARLRCAEMGIGTKVAKRIAMNPTLTRPGNTGTNCTFVMSTLHPEYAVVVAPATQSRRPVIVTIVFYTPDGAYVRNGATYTPKETVQ